MTPEELLRRYPRETLRWLRRRLHVSQLDLAVQLGVAIATVAGWEQRRSRISPRNRDRLGQRLAPHLATPEGEAFIRSLGRGAE